MFKITYLVNNATKIINIKYFSSKTFSMPFKEKKLK